MVYFQPAGGFEQRHPFRIERDSADSVTSCAYFPTSEPDSFRAPEDESW